MTAAGHGIYYHYGFNDWRAQRDPSNGIIEDFITPSYASELADWLNARSLAPTSFVRSGSAITHVPSGQPWWKVAARYYLQVLYPDNSEIWHSRPNDNSNLREYNEDINSRPLFANHIGADTLLHLHTNGPSATATGTRVLYQPGRTEDLQLGNSILCYMKELIQAQEPYQDWVVPDQANAGNKGENRLASMPSVIVELGFHTNPTDAAALKDPVFRTAAMKGVEKGYRLNAEDKPCEPFEITSIPDVTIPRPGAMDVPVNFKGFPFFPVILTVENIVCPAGNTCTGGTITYAEQQDSPLYFQFSCSGSSNSTDTSLWRSYLTDVDGVKTNTVEHGLTCLPTSGAVAKSKPSVGVGPAN